VPAKTLADYIGSLFIEEDELLSRLRSEAEQQGLPAIQVKPEIGRLLRLIIMQSGASKVLEIGTLFGYSAILMARELPEDGRLITLEVEPRHAAIARRNFNIAGLAHRIELLEGPALDSLTSLAGRTFDLVFIDADKQSYPQYLEWALKLTVRGSIIVTDNVWRGGSVAEPATSDGADRAIFQFNREVARHPRLFSAIVPRLDGSDAACISYVRG